MIGAEDENIAAVRLHKIVTHLVDENLVPGIDGAARNDFAAFVMVADRDFEIVAQLVRRTIDEELLPLADQPRKCEEEEKPLLLDVFDLVIFVRDDIDVIAA